MLGSVVVIFSIFGLSACSKDVVVKPAPLVQFTQTIHVQKQWTNSVSTGGDGVYLKLTPAVANGKIFIVGTNGKVKAVDGSNGKTFWEINTKTTLSSGLGANATMLFVGTADGQVLALQQSNGRVVWQVPVIGDVLATPAANNSVVIVRTESGHLSALNVADGKVLWRYEQQEPALILRGNSAPKIVGGMVLCGFANGELIAFDIDSGKVIWRQQIAVATSGFLVESMVDIVADPVITDGVVYVASHHGNVAALHLKTGRVIWQKALSSDVDLAVADGKLYVIDTDSRLWALAITDGATLWQQNIFVNRGLSAPAIMENLIAVGDAEGYVHWLDVANGRMVARTKMSGGIVVTPVIYGRSLYVFSVTGNLTKFSRY